MFKKLLFLAGWLTAAVMASPAEKHRNFGRCGSPHPDEDLLAKAEEFAVQERRLVERSMVDATEININTYMHVVAADKTVRGGYVDRRTLEDQIAVLNADFAPAVISFTLMSADWTVNPGWSRNESEVAMKRRLRRGTYADLNLYCLSDLASNLGSCYLPGRFRPDSEEFYKDGCTILAGSMPGGILRAYDKGKTTVHEVGHWLGLFHTFYGGCNGNGDHIDDTPAQKSASSGCPVGRDSCSNQPGFDPIHNFMDYSIDSCLWEFTPG